MAEVVLSTSEKDKESPHPPTPGGGETLCTALTPVEAKCSHCLISPSGFLFKTNP